MPIVVPIGLGVLEHGNQTALLYLLLEMIGQRGTGNLQKGWHDVHLAGECRAFRIGRNISCWPSEEDRNPRSS